MSIEIRGATKLFGNFTAFEDISLKVETGELVALLGPSGSGKTTLLRVIAGLERPDRGEVLFDGVPMASRRVGERGVGFVFQHYALFRHMTVFENVAFGLRVKPRGERPTREAIRATVRELLELVQLEGMADRFPSQLSGGQRQRVALARALAIEPRVLLLDEPFGALDARVRQELRRWLRRLHDQIHITSVFVTHDQEEALEVADRIVVMNHGRIEQVGTPDEVYEHPANLFVYHFLGKVNLFRRRVDDGAFDKRVESDADVGYVRPHEIDIYRSRESPTAVETVVESIYGAGPLVRVEMRRVDDQTPLEALLPKERFDALNLRIGETVFTVPRKLRVFGDAGHVVYHI
jgi:sulfate transport system ATP-binding protein